jgi:hypothetical protein
VDLDRIEVFDRGVHRLAEHERVPDGASLAQGEPNRRRRYDLTLLMERLAGWGELAARFAERLRTHQRYAGPELEHLLSLQLTWSAQDIVAALEHAMRYEAYQARAVERILEARFRPRSLQGQMAETTRTQIREAMREHPVRQRPLSDYATLRGGDPPISSIPTQTAHEEAAREEATREEALEADNTDTSTDPDPDANTDCAEPH